MIRQFSHHWPRVDVKNYDSATTPGYHLLMAMVWKQSGADARWVNLPVPPMAAEPKYDFPGVKVLPADEPAWRRFIADLRPLQCVNMLMGLGLILTLYFGAARFVAWWVAVALTLPLAMNQYVLGASIWLTTDNAGWWFAVSALSLAALGPETAVRAAGAGVWATLTVLVRQVHLWAIAPVFIAGVWSGAGEVEREHRTRRIVFTLLACAVPVLVVAGFAWLWGGLTPPSPRIRDVHGKGLNLAAPAFALALSGAYAICFLGAWRSELSRLFKPGWMAVAVIVVGVGLALAVPTSTQQPTFTDPPMRGYGWLWRVSGMFPALHDRSPLLVALAPMGGLALLMLWRAARANGRARSATILLVGLAGWLAAQTANPAAWQRYFDPIILISLAWLAAMGVPARSLRTLTAGAAILAMGFGAMSYKSIWREIQKNELPFDGGVLRMQEKPAAPVNLQSPEK